METTPAKTFNTTGPCVPCEHYMLPVLPRLPLVDDMIAGKFYFVIHAPRQSGKTTFLHELVNNINSKGLYYSFCCSLEINDRIKDINSAIDNIITSINLALAESPVSALNQKAFLYDNLPGMDNPSFKIRLILNRLSVDLDKELIVFFDEADCLSAEDQLIVFLRQIRNGYNNRSISKFSKFPRSLALVGMRDIRDYLTQVRPDEQSKGVASPFNIKKKALTLANFTEIEIGALYRQHTLATGQIFEDAAVASTWYWSEGQPWLVNALADVVVTERLNKDYSVTITKDHIDEAAEILIQRRDAHIDSLLTRLTEPRVIKVMDAVFSGSLSSADNLDDRRYCLDLGLVTERENGTLWPANQIYKEVMSRVISDQIQRIFNLQIERKNWSDGKVLFVSELLNEFQQFFRHDSDSFPKQYENLAAYDYDEAIFSFMLLAYLQFAFNGSARVVRQFAEGRGAVDIAVLYQGREYLIEVKIKKNTSLPKSLKQIDGYLDKTNESEGWLVIVDKDPKKSWNKKIYWKTQEYNGKTIHVIGC
ncbi:MAG: AAA-like domain-containing protein [Deltaproteobacteria bacterium]|jgi:hypothetical protein|nr:AAA-like domain-containing protein [Deltaproteobacteria bacterium]